MKNVLLVSAFVLSALSLSASAKDAFKMIYVNDLATMIESHDAKLAVYDVNSPKTRKADGVIPGAKLLSSASKFDVKKEMPAQKDAKLVFYCANTECTASHSAAKRAMENGYTDVSVMADGIQGWLKAGKPASKI